MSKGNSNFKSKKPHSAKPYDVSQSFVSKVASRVSELLPQRTWWNRWLSSDIDSNHQFAATAVVHHPSSTPMVNSHHSNVSPDHHGPGPSKRPRLPFNSPPMFVHNKFLPSTPIHEEEISPIVPPTLSNNDSAVAGPSGLCQFSKKINFTPTSTGSGTDPPQINLEDKLMAATRRSSTTADKQNGDDCSETSESTSGCSSLVPQAQTSQIRRSESRHLNLPRNKSSSSALDRSLFPGRSSPKIDLSSLHRRRPSFDTTTFTSSSRLMNISANPNQTMSPFYSGRTMYGGASAYNSSTASSSGLFSQTPRRLGVTVRPINANRPSEPALSTTAKKILDALEQFSTPVVDAKRMPIMPGAKRKLERYAELNLPTTSELLLVKRRERLQKSTSAARQASLSSSHRDPKSSLNSEPAEYRLRTDDSGDEKHTNKITRKNGGSYGTRLEEVHLPTAVLPVKMLPKIDIPIPPCPKIATSTVTSSIVSIGTSSFARSIAGTATNAGVSSSSGNGGGMFVMALDREFKISAPLPVQADISSRTSSNVQHFNFVFSEPIGQNSKKEKSGFSFSNSHKSKDSNSNTFSFLNAMSENKNNSVGNTVSLGSNKLNIVSNDIKIIESTMVTRKSSDNSKTVDTISSIKNSDSKVSTPDNNCWKCPTCMVRNSKDSNVCSACEAKKTTTTSVTSSSPLLYKPPPDTWECKECLIRNKNSVRVCAACSAPKLVSKPSASSSIATSTTKSTSIDHVKVTTSFVRTAVSSVTSTTVTSGFGDKFKPPSDTWECKECFVRNKNNVDKCVSCGTVKLGAALTEKKPFSTTASAGFGSMFKKPEGCWECSACMIQNISKHLKCVACETPKPGAEKVTTTTTTSSITSSGFTFGIPTTCSSGTGFSLPTGNSTSKKEEKTTLGFQFGGSTSNSISGSNASANFTFGIPVAKSVGSDADKSPKEKKMNAFVNDKLPNPLQELSKLQGKTTGNTQSTFKFGVNHEKSNEKHEINIDKNPATNKSPFSLPEASKNGNESTSKTIDNLFKTKNDLTEFNFGSKAPLEKTDNAKTTSNIVLQSQTDQPAVGGSKLFENLSSKTTESNTKAITQSDNNFTFGSNASGSPAFSAASLKSNPSPNSLFVFGSAASSAEKKTNNIFGSSNKDGVQKPNTLAAESKPVFGTNKETSPIFGNVKPVTPVFSTNSMNDVKPVLSSNLTNSTNVPTFAAPASSNASTGGFKQENPAAAPSYLPFGSNAQTPFQTQPTSQQPEKSVFGMNSANPLLQTNPTTQSSGFSFGGSSGVSNNEPVKPLFGFGSGSSQTPSSSFSFAAPSSTVPAQNFNFTPKEAEPSSGFNFSVVTPVQNTQAPAPVFGVQNPTPSFGNTSTPNNLFSFGTQSQPQPASTTPAFGFNSSQGSTPVSNAFVFGSANAETNQTPVTATQPTVPAFDPNARPTFNFTGGSTPSFTATPSLLPGAASVTPVAQRPKKKAVRRSGQLR